MAISWWSFALTENVQLLLCLCRHMLHHVVHVVMPSLSLSLSISLSHSLSLSFSVLVQGEVVPKGQQFMIQLLVNSLMADQGLENSLRTAIAMETKDEEETLHGQQIQEQVVPLLHLVQQLISNTTSVLLPYLKQV